MNKPQLINFCEFDKYAVQSYCAIHNVDLNLNLGDITKVNEKEIADFNMMTWGFPCTDISVAGKQKGFIDEEGNKTRSGMYYEGIRILREKKPALSIVENVKALTSKKFKDEFNMVLKDLDDAGYNNYWQILNAKDYGIPQNRERVFLISIRKDLDNGKFVFPKGFDNGLRLKDLLDNEVDKKYYLSEKLQSRFVSKIEGENIVGRLPNGNGTNFSNDMVFSTDNNIGILKTTDYKDPKKILCGIDKSYNNPELIENANCITAREDRGISNRKAEGTAVIETNRYIQNGINPTLQTLQGGNRQPKILERKDIKHSDKICEYCGKPLIRKRFNERLEDFNVFNNRKYCDRACMRKAYLKIGDNYNQNFSNAHTTARKINLLIMKKDCCEKCGSDKNLDIHHIDGNWNNNNIDNLMCLCRSCHTKYERNKNKSNIVNYRVRKLTPLECFYLMGFSKNDFDKAKSAGVSDSQLYKQAGNSIVTYVLYEIYKELYKAMPYLFDNIKLSSFFSGIGAFEIALNMFYNYIITGEEQNFYTTTNGLNSVCGEHKPILVGGVGEINFGKQYSQGNRVYSSNHISMRLLAQPVGNAGENSYLYVVDDTNRVIKECIPQPVKTRVNKVDIDGLKQLLRSSKQKSKLSNKQISEMTSKPLTLVEHWFRMDNCFSIPDEDIWFKLKEILGINEETFDAQVIEFEIKDGVYEKAERCYYDFGICPTLTTVNTDEKIIITR